MHEGRLRWTDVSHGHISEGQRSTPVLRAEQSFRRYEPCVPRPAIEPPASCTKPGMAVGAPLSSVVAAARDRQRNPASKLPRGKPTPTEISIRVEIVQNARPSGEIQAATKGANKLMASLEELVVRCGRGRCPPSAGCRASTQGYAQRKEKYPQALGT
jgi:hypothetical protein